MNCLTVLFRLVKEAYRSPPSDILFVLQSISVGLVNYLEPWDAPRGVG